MKKRFFAVLLCVVMLTSMLAAITVSAAEGVIDRVSLSGNTTFYSSKVEGKTLNVTAYDAEGNVVSLDGKEITYTSSRPWVFDIADNGTIIDNECDGTTIVTATVGGVPGSTIMIKSTSDTAATAGFESDLTAGSRNVADGKAYAGYYSGSYQDASTISRIEGERYLNKNWQGLYYRGAWDSDETGGANIRVAQGWFYDDLATAAGTAMYITFANEYAEKIDETTYSLAGGYNTSIDSTNGYLPAYAELGFDSSIKAALSANDILGYYYHGEIQVKKDSDYYYYYGKASSVKRSQGWHQATLIIDDNAKVDLYIDGIRVNTDSTAQKPVIYTAKPATEDHRNRGNTLTTVFYCDDFVFAQNLNTEEPEDFKLEAKSITLSRNETFIKSVDETKELVVTPLDKNGNEGKLPEGTTFTYESTRPWVLDIDDATGKFIDGGYDGTTKITVKTSNDLEASVIFIKNSDNIYADTSYQSGEGSNKHGDVKDIGAGLMARGTWVIPQNNICYVRIDLGNVSEADIAAAKIPGENYYKLPAGTEYTPAPNYAISSGYGGLNEDAQNSKTSWYKEDLRVMQGWFYDDGTSAIHLRSFMSETIDYLGGMYASGISHLYWQADIKAATDAENYSIAWTHDVTENTRNTIARSKGWHQLITVLNDDHTIDVFIDGELLSNSKSAYNGYEACRFYIVGASAGNYDELVVAANPNTTKPMTITASAGANGTVSPELAETHVGKNVEFTITPDEGYIIDTITYNGLALTPTNNKVNVIAVNGADTLSVTFKAEVKAPSIKTTTAMTTNGITHGEANIPAAITYIEIVPGNASTVNEAGILLGVDGIEKVLKAYASYTDEDTYTLLTSGAFAIKVYGEAVNNKDCTAVPYLKYTMNGEDGEVKGEEASFKIVK